jgi:hypothetical protein
MKSVWLLALLAGCDLAPPGVPAGIDDDGDGSPAGEDCDDTDPSRFPAAEWPIDADGDGWVSGSVVACEPPEDALAGTSAGEDCDDGDPQANALVPGWADGDGDGYGAGAQQDFCGPLATGFAPSGEDCDDALARTHPGAPEDCGAADLDCTPGNDPTCAISGTIVLQITGDEWFPEVGTAPPQLDADPRADAILLGDYDVGASQVTARWYDLDDAGVAGPPDEYTFDSPLFGHSLEFLVFPDLDADGRPDVWLVNGDFNDQSTTIWDLDDVSPGDLDPADALIDRSLPDPFSALAGAADAAEDLRADPGVEVALRAFSFSDNGRVEIWGGFGGTPAIQSLVTGPIGGGYFGGDVLATDLDGDGVTDLAVSRSSADQSEEAVYVFHGPFPADRNAADADATFVLSGGMPYAHGQVEPAADLMGDGVAWLYWSAPEQTFGGRVYALPGDLLTVGPTDPQLVESRGVSGTTEFPGFGTAMDSVGDQTGDGVADVIVGAPLWDGLSQNAAFLLDSNAIAAGAGGTLDTPGLVAARIESQLLFGYVVSSAGDVNGDGAEDVWIGADGPAFLLFGGVDR